MAEFVTRRVKLVRPALEDIRVDMGRLPGILEENPKRFQMRSGQDDVRHGTSRFEKISARNLGSLLRFYIWHFCNPSIRTQPLHLYSYPIYTTDYRTPSLAHIEASLAALADVAHEDIRSYFRSEG